MHWHLKFVGVNIMGWFKSKEQKLKEDEIFEKIINHLKAPNNWTKNDTKYSHIHLNLAIKYGHEYYYEHSEFVFYLSEPECIDIPRRHRNAIKNLLLNIDKRDEHDGISRLDFINNHLDGKYQTKIVLNDDKNKSLHKIWLQENGISDYYYCKYNTYYFNDEAEAMAFKIMWDGTP